MKLVKGNLSIGVKTRFGPNWPGIRCLAKTRRGTECQSAAYKHNGSCRLHGTVHRRTESGGLTAHLRGQSQARTADEGQAGSPAPRGRGRASGYG